MHRARSGELVKAPALLPAASPDRGFRWDVQCSSALARGLSASGEHNWVTRASIRMSCKALPRAFDGPGNAMRPPLGGASSLWNLAPIGPVSVQPAHSMRAGGCRGLPSACAPRPASKVFIPPPAGRQKDPPQSGIGPRIPFDATHGLHWMLPRRPPQWAVILVTACRRPAEGSSPCSPAHSEGPAVQSELQCGGTGPSYRPYRWRILWRPL